MSRAELPKPVRDAGVNTERLLDVRPVLEKGGDPFRLIMETSKSLGAGEALHLIVGFEPRPLYAVMATMGRKHHVEPHDDLFHVWFYPDGAAVAETPVAAKRVPLRPPVELDVRGFEPPQPMVVVLEKLTELGDGAQLLVRHHREPVLLYEKLRLRGYDARSTQKAEGDWSIHIAPVWFFEEQE
ncbi:MAG: DUF2249 domain-containing protein [Deltaproteobacteria bacterium]|nr:DUF2249 domain-containing protein [Deltaproteobacteria bacterium]